MAEEKTDFEKGVEAIDRERKGGYRNENYKDALDKIDPEPTIFERVHERYVDEDRKGNFIKED